MRPGGEEAPRFRSSVVGGLIYSYVFNCCGRITEWGAFVERSSEQYVNGVYSIAFNVFRLNSPSGKFSNIGTNIFQNITLGIDLARGLIRETPVASEIISVQPGDRIGFAVTAYNNGDDGIQFAGDNDNIYPYEEESVWFTNYNVMSSLQLHFTNLAPLIVAVVCKFS